MLSARGLRRAYGGRTVIAIEALDLEAGSITALVGPNGSGKSTLLRLLAFVERADAGTLRLDDRPVVTAAERRRARRQVTLVEQRPFLFPGTVLDNLRYALSLHGVRGRAADERAAHALERLSLRDLTERRARSLSDGEAHRVALARALALEPRALLLDEPVSTTDRAAARDLYRALEEARDRGVALCLASHQLEEAYRFSERVVGLADGRLTPVTPENLFRTVISEGDGEIRDVDIGPLKLRVVTDRTGPATVAIPPDDILVSLTPLPSSAQNQLSGHVTRISDDGRGGVTLAVDAGVELHARITHRALEQLGIQLGSRVVLAVKATAVRVY